jgi:hypothetical protein
VTDEKEVAMLREQVADREARLIEAWDKLHLLRKVAEAADAYDGMETLQFEPIRRALAAARKAGAVNTTTSLQRTVYAIEAGDYDDHMVVGVELTREAAEASLARWDKSEDGRMLGRGGIVEYKTGVIYGDDEWIY